MIHAVDPLRRERRRADRAEGILDAALAIVAREGIDALTLGRLARELNLVPAALYRYFPSKDAIVAALQRRSLEDVAARFAEARAGWEGRLARCSVEVRALGGLRAAARFYVGLPAAAPETWTLVALLLGDPRMLLPDEEAARSAPLVTALILEVTRAFDEAARTGALARGSGAERALVFWAALQGATQLAKLARIAPDAPTPARVGDLAAEALLRGWGADPSRLALAARALERDGKE